MYVNPLSPDDASKHHFKSQKTDFIFLQLRGFIGKISIKPFYQYKTIFVDFSPSSNYLYPLQVGNCDSNIRLVADEDDTGKFRLESVNDAEDECDSFLTLSSLNLCCHLHPLQAANCCRNSRLVVDGDDL